MKKIILGLLAGFAMMAATTTQTKAQVNLSVQIGAWTPPAEYSGVNYYYLPDVESYYYVPTHQYVYQERGSWVFRNSLPPRYATYDIRNGYKVAVNRPRAYTYYNVDRPRYARYRGTRNVIVRDHYVVHNRVVHARPRVVNRTRVVHSRPRVVNHTRVVNRTKVVHRPANNGHHSGHDKH
ncbi:hypothetical protein SAMN05216464_11223 [Mucilaginibacter pineti]|uniref:YXWGXW repeat-containing protein n=1 Tax=Mucilaginibacter pineti TaxID=1391627 RepID=A0A1G7HU49_9SPHI|nr:hypothetical protein [Mucilaginibacter pineti]SDF03764.1 hypothetical protein SAMN05216464_11223 [Mucilaginibacter pineti]